jgi:hypothetical protein
LAGPGLPVSAAYGLFYLFFSRLNTICIFRRDLEPLRASDCVPSTVMLFVSSG